MTEPRRDSIEPRPEAVPLRFDELTEEQRQAGAQAALLLRGMAQEHGKASTAPPTMHSYLPVIYKEPRGNRVVLLDGTRGSGKSALLVTLLDAYSTALSEQRVPEGYDAWLGPADRVVPVGLVDLQPLPSTTRLLFHLVANLERVVEAMELRQDHPRLGTAAWHPGSENESRSRTRWRNFVRVAASGWDDNLEARKGKLDAEAFAVEVEQGELQRLDLARSFREFVDALVEDYRVWNHWQAGPPPLFLLAIDDADMNPELSEPLLELVRKLWHPRLAFLLTGDSELFLSTLAKSRGPLGPDVYTKAIPQRHRCLLPQLSLRQRLEKEPPALGKLLGEFRLPRQGHPSRPSGTLADYFVDAQVREVLPGRLRALWELRYWLEPAITTANKKSGSPSDEAMERIWQWSLRAAPIAPALRERLAPMVRLNGTRSELNMESGISLEWSAGEMLRELDIDRAQVFLTRPLRLGASLNESGENQSLDSLVTSALVLVTNFLADTERLGVTLPELPSRLSTLLLAGVILKVPMGDGPNLFAWPLPEWEAPLDVMRLSDTWAIHLSTVNSSAPQALEQVAQSFLRTILSVGLGTVGGKKRAASSWKELASDIASAARPGATTSKRQRLLREWAQGRAGLLAAPESGLPATVANALLKALRGAFQQDWEAARQAMRVTRFERVRQTFKEQLEKEAQPKELVGFLRKLDQQFPEHQFRQLVEAPDDEAAPAAQISNDFRQLLENIQLPALNRVLGEMGGFTLAKYLTPLRREWLQQASPALLRSTLQELSLFTQIQDAGASALAGLWKTWCEAADVSGLAAALQLQDGQLLISEDYRHLLDEKREQKRMEPGHLSFGSKGRLESRVQVPSSAREPFLTLASTSMAEHALEAVLRMAYDHGQDLSEASADEEVSPVGWRGVQLRFKNGEPLHLWTVPRWPSLFEWEFLEHSWQEAERLARGAGGISLSPPSPKVLDGLAYWLMSACQSLQSRNELSQRFKMEPSVSDWRTLIIGQWRPRFHNQEVRPHLYKPWRRLIPLLATPESGLSETAATIILGLILRQRSDSNDAWSSFADALNQTKSGVEILEALKEAFANTDEWNKESKQLSPSLLKSRRRQRLIEAGVAEEQVDALLTDIDNTFPNHPWVRVFGPWGGTSRLLPPG